MKNSLKSRLLTFLCIIAAWGFLGLIAGAPPDASAAGIREVAGKVTKVSDGDTVHVVTAEGTKLRVRLYGMDAPETAKTDRSGRLKSPGQPWGDEAEKALAGKILDRSVRVQIIDVDRYRRMVAILWLDDRNINLEMVREGHAEAYKEYLGVYRTEFLKTEQEAKSARRGIWSLPNYERPGDFRKRMRFE